MDKKSVFELAREIADLARDCRECDKLKKNGAECCPEWCKMFVFEQAHEIAEAAAKAAESGKPYTRIYKEA